MADDNHVRREPPAPITEEEKARRRDIISRTDHSALLAGGKRSDLGRRAAELWINGEITAEEKMEMVKDRLRQIAEKNGVVHAGVGKASFDEAKLRENLMAFVDAVSRAKPAGAKGSYLQKVSGSSTPASSASLSAASPSRRS